MSRDVSNENLTTAEDNIEVNVAESQPARSEHHDVTAQDNVIVHNLAYSRPQPVQRSNGDFGELAALRNVRIPAFWRVNPTLWFTQVEAQFHINGIRSDNSKFNAVVGYLDPEILNEVSDLVQAPPDKDKYTSFKKQLIARFSESKERQLNRLMTGLELGDRRPSSFLREMRRLSGENFPDEMLTTLWMSRMPGHIRGILSAKLGIPLNTLAEIADRILENTSGPGVCSTTATLQEEPSNDLHRRVKKIEDSLVHLTNKISALAVSQGKPQRQRSRSRPRSSSTSQENTGLCFYHKKFGIGAKKCLNPCSYEEKQGK